MRSLVGRDTLSLKDWERAEFFHMFAVCDELVPIARSRRNSDLLADKTLLTRMSLLSLILGAME